MWLPTVQIRLPWPGWLPSPGGPPVAVFRPDSTDLPALSAVLGRGMEAGNTNVINYKVLADGDIEQLLLRRVLERFGSESDVDLERHGFGP